MFVLPDWVPVEEWNGFLEMRKKKRIPTTERAKELAVKSLEKLSKMGFKPSEVLDQSTLNGWTGLFPIREPEMPLAKGNGKVSTCSYPGCTGPGSQVSRSGHRFCRAHVPL